MIYVSLLIEILRTRPTLIFWGATFTQAAAGQAPSVTLTYTQTVTPTATTLASSANPSVVGQQVTYTATVSPVPDGGTVAFTDGTTTITECGAQPVDTSTGKATCTVTYTSPGAHSITATYGGDNSFSDSSGSLTHTVNQAATSTALASSPSLGRRRASGVGSSPRNHVPR